MSMKSGTARRSRTVRGRPLDFLCGLGVAAACALPSAAWADPSPYCREVHARAASDAALLMAPQVIAQAIRFPTNGVDLALIGARNQYQVRGGLAFSPLDFYKGLRLSDVAEADCEQHRARATIEELLLHASDAGRLAALRRQAAYLDAHAAEWRALTKKAEEQFTARVITLIELTDLWSRAVALDRKVAQTHGEAARLEARGDERPGATLRALADSYAAGARRFERAASGVRALAAWQIKLTGGIVPTDQPVDWYGLAEVSFNLGAFVRGSQEGHYLEARDDELTQARYEVGSRLREFQSQVEGIRTQARRELEIVERQSGAIASTRRALEGGDAPNVAHALAILTLDEISVGSDQAYLLALIDDLSSFSAEKAHDS